MGGSYLSISVENFVTIGIMLLAWMLALQLLGQFGVHIQDYIPKFGS
jgi:hypothetical protein